MEATEIKIGMHVRIVDPTRVVAFTRTPSLWTAGVYVVADMSRPGYTYPDGIVAVRPYRGPRVAFRVGTDNIEAVR